MKRRGRFKVSWKLIEDFETALPLFAYFVITRAEALYDSRVIEYTAFSLLFDEVEEYDQSPEYKIICNGPGLFEAKRLT